MKLKDIKTQEQVVVILTTSIEASLYSRIYTLAKNSFRCCSNSYLIKRLFNRYIYNETQFED